MRYPKLRELKEAVKALIKGPYTTKFPYKPHEPAEKFRGKPEYSEEFCVGCGACFEVCPADAIEMEDITNHEPPIRRFTVKYDHCIFCGNCQANCITEKGITLGKEYELSTFDRTKSRSFIEKELVLCEICGAVITCKDHLKWISDRLDASSFSNPTLFLTQLKSIGIDIKDLLKYKSQKSRLDRIKILCAKCRRKTTLEE